MGYKVVAPIETNPLEGIGLGISYNTLKPIYISIDQAIENVKNLLLTRKGERLIHINFGTELLNILFEPNVADLKDEIRDIINDAIDYWLPYVNIDNIDIITAEDDPSLPHNIKITITVSINELRDETIVFAVNESGELEVR
tara:strand:- start:268 stop:693 length:426 start_codon:yes stop_codon:yes gene_type:complete